MYTYKSKLLELALDDKLRFTSIIVDSTEILLEQGAPLIQIGMAGKLYTPLSVSGQGQRLTAVFDRGLYAELEIQEKTNSVTFEVTNISPEADALLFGPIPNILNETVGEVIGVARGQGLAFGAQALNIKTLSGVAPDYWEQTDKKYPHGDYVTGISVGHIAPMDCAAMRVTGGSVLQFKCLKRSIPRHLTVLNVPDVYVPPMEGPDAEIPGARLALFGCREEDALNHIGTIEIEENLPHPIIDGEWGKTARTAMCSYLITDFGEEDLDFVLEKAKTAGLRYIYEGGPFESWGHFTWLPGGFSDGDETMKAMVEKAGEQGIKIGVHTLTNFLSTTDAYVTPVPSEHLLKQGTVKLLGAIDENETNVVVERSHFFEAPATLNAVQIGSEILQYSRAELTEKEIILTGCTRGAFETVKSAHAAGAPASKLWDYPYNTLFPDLVLQDEFCDRLVKMFNFTGIRQISFDGLEGCSYTGEDEYAVNRFVSRCWDGWNGEIINDASGLHHFTWHIHTRMNWGEPWGEEMREGQVAYRISNQQFFARNLFPRMLGWFLLRTHSKKFEASTMEDLEWALSESAGFDAGYAMTIDMGTLLSHGQIDSLLEAMKHWDSLRLANAFTEEQKERLRDPKTEWHLEKAGEGMYKIYPMAFSKYFCCDLAEMQPGQTGGSDWVWECEEERPFALRIRVAGEGRIQNPTVATQKGRVKFLCTLEENQYLLYGFDGKAVVTDKNFNPVSEAEVVGSALLPKGSYAVAFSCQHSKADTPEVKVKYFTRGEPWTIVNKPEI